MPYYYVWSRHISIYQECMQILSSITAGVWFRPEIAFAQARRIISTHACEGLNLLINRIPDERCVIQTRFQNYRWVARSKADKIKPASADIYFFVEIMWRCCHRWQRTCWHSNFWRT